jgi:hypothetical protein
MEIINVISKKVSFQPNAWSAIGKIISIEEVIKDIKRGRYENEVTKLRDYLKNNEVEKYDIYKKRLPGVTFCASFKKIRKKEYIENYNNLIVIDIDKLGPEELQRNKDVLKNDEYVFTYWVSPSEKGIKGLIYVSYKNNIIEEGIDKSHKNAFQQITFYFKDKYSIDLDISGSDTTRLCFLSYDPNLIFKSSIVPYDVKEFVEPILTMDDTTSVQNKQKKQEVKLSYLSSKDTLNNPKGKNAQRNKKMIVKIIKYLKSSRISITGSYEDWYRVAYAVASSFTHNIGEKYYLSLCELDGIKHDEIQSKNMLLYCYQNNKGIITFNTIVFLAQTKGFKI